MVAEIHRSKHEMRNFFIFQNQQGRTTQPIVRVGKTSDFYDRPDQSYQLPKESG